MVKLKDLLGIVPMGAGIEVWSETLDTIYEGENWKEDVEEQLPNTILDCHVVYIEAYQQKLVIEVEPYKA